ncbi:cbb3-type cytochrome c oxidase subunit I [Tropicibacter sp. Alg240-R139]|uniref:cbb3-type cytochrome c oxidase subunit I n=1 Tax=Tropicibacter sp. Alg240-R139 TaxID=2305991 RepID=UPI001F07E9EE|nr:cbb3-type cytochrome c oxidase subunit I [Tropicibacter sp. Alg240-R139]
MTENASLLLGRLGLDALPFYSWVAFSGALVTLAGGVGFLVLVTWLGQWRALWTGWLTSVDHKRIGIMYIVLALVMLVRGFVDAIMMRLQQAMSYNREGYLPPEHFEQIFSSHGTIMIFFMAMPFMTGLLNYIIPLQIGARDVAFPVLNAISFWLTFAGAGLMLISLVIGKFSTAGWTGYPPYSGVEFTPGVGVDYWIWSILVSGVGTTMTGINFVVTILRKRAPGMLLMRMPLFTWTGLCSSILIIFAFPALTVSTTMLALDRTLGMHFFTNDGGGNVMNYMNLFWIWGHPEVYILILPAFGIFSEVVATFSSKRLFGYPSLVYATAVIAVLSFTVWLHHFFTMGAGANVNAIFGIATMVIAVPTGVKVFDWLFTMFRGRIRFEPPMLFTIGFMCLFVIGGMSGVLLAIPPINYSTHNTTFLVAHFHNMIIPGVLFGYLAGYMYWFPKAFGFQLDRVWGARSFWFWMIGFLLAFMPLYALGLMGMPRRLETYGNPEWQPLLIVAFVGACLILMGIISLVMQLWVSVKNRKALVDQTGDPWDGRTLEWSMPSPPPIWNFDNVPVVSSRDAFHEAKLSGIPLPAAEEDSPLSVPKNSVMGPCMGVAGMCIGFGAVWYIWWLAFAGLAIAVAAIIGRSFVQSTENDVSFKRGATTT